MAAVGAYGAGPFEQAPHRGSKPLGDLVARIELVGRCSNGTVDSEPGQVSFSLSQVHSPGEPTIDPMQEK